MISKDSLKGALDGLFASMEKSHELSEDEAYVGIKDSPVVIQAVNAIKECNPDDLDVLWHYHIDSAMGGMIRTVWPDLKNTFIFEKSTFVASHLEKLFSRFEGFACSSDKSRTVMCYLAKHLCKGSDIKFNYQQEYTYHLPVVVLTTQEEILEFYDAITHLFYGNPDKYMSVWLKLIKLSRDHQEREAEG